MKYTKNEDTQDEDINVIPVYDTTAGEGVIVEYITRKEYENTFKGNKIA